MSDHISQEEFDAAIDEIVREEGLERLLALPGVFEIAMEHHNNEAIRRIEAARESE